MKGIVFTVLNEMIEKKFGMEFWDSLLVSTGHEGAYTAAASYPDEEILSLVSSLSQQTRIPANDLVKAFGEYLFEAFVRQYPTLFQNRLTAKEMLKSVDGIIHVEMKKLHPEATLPKFDYEEPSDDTLVMIYRSERKLCPLVEGLLTGTAKHFDTQISFLQTRCIHQGNSHCRFELTFGGANV